MVLRPRLLASLGLSALVGCSLTTDLGGLSGGAAPGTDGGSVTSSDAGTTEGGSASDDAAADGGVPSDAGAYFFRDEFNRADGPGLGGNGWIEKAPAFALFDGALVRFNMNGTSSDYRDNVAYRPSGEAVRDVDVSMQFAFMFGGGGWVQVHARVQSASVTTPNTLDSYLVFRNLDVNDNRTFTIARQRGNGTYATLGTFQTASALQVGTPYRLRLVVKGTSPVSLEGIVERASGAAWAEIGRGTASDSDPERIESAGVVGISSGNDQNGAYQVDDFEARGL